MRLNPAPIITGWGEAKNGPVPVWALWFQNVYNIITNDVSGSLVIAPATGAITSYTATYRLKQIGDHVSLIFDITIIDAGTGGGALNVTLPNTASSNISGTAFEIASTKFTCSCSGLAGTSFGIVKYDGTGMIATSRRFIGDVTYFAKST